MTHDASGPTTPDAHSTWFREHLQRRSFPWKLVGLLVLATAPLGFVAKFVTSVHYEENPPPCYGLGWGCSFSPGDVGVLMAIFWLLAVGCIAALLLVTELFWRRVAIGRSVATLVLAAIALVCWIVIGLPLLH